MRFVCLWQWLGKGFHALHGVHVKCCPKAEHRALPVGIALGWAGNSCGLGFCGAFPGCLQAQPLKGSFLGGSQWAHLPHFGCVTLAWHCALGHFFHWELGSQPLRGTIPLERPVGMELV